MSNYDEIIAYIPYFNQENSNFCKWTTGQDTVDGSLILPYPEYDREFTHFIDAVHDAQLLNGNYFEILNERVPDKKYRAAISAADVELLSAILTYYVRAERYCDGAWETAYQEQIFLKILLRLKEIVDIH